MKTTKNETKKTKSPKTIKATNKAANKEVTSVRTSATGARRNSIMNAALECFITLGMQATTMEEIRTRAGASIGSIYHHFTNKEQLAGELYYSGLQNYQQGLIDLLKSIDDAETGIKSMVDYHLNWIAEHKDLARYLFYMRHNEFVASAETQIKELNKNFFKSLFNWLNPHIEQGHIRSLPPEIYSAILIGPSQDFARHWLTDRVRTDLKVARTMLADAAWNSLRVIEELPDNKSNKKIKTRK